MQKYGEMNCEKCYVLFKYKISPSRLTRRFCSKKCSSKAKPNTQKDSRHFLWKGENVSYSALHKWLRRKYGIPEKCEHCYMVGYKKNGKWNIQWANRTGKYLRKRQDWMTLCQKCHKLQEKEMVI